MITDLPGIYSLSPYTLEEVVARNYLLNERPDAILNIVDGTNLERNLYLTTQLTELGIPVVVAVNMIDVVHKNGDRLNVEALSAAIGCPVVEISALKGTGISAAAEAAIKAAQSGSTLPQHSFSGPVEHALAHIEEVTVHDLPEEQQRWYAIKLFERDEKVSTQLQLSDSVKDHIEKDIQAVEKELDDDAESIITNERYVYIASIIKGCYKRKTPKGCPHPTKSTGWSPTALRRFRFSRLLCFWFITYPFPPSARLQPTGQTTACSATAGICSASALPPMKKR